MHIGRFQAPNLCISSKFQQNNQQAHRGPVVREPATRIARGNAPDSKPKAPEQRRRTRGVRAGEPRGRTRGVRAGEPRVGQEALGPSRYRVQRNQIRRSARIRERRILAPPRCRLRERRILAPPRCRLREPGRCCRHGAESDRGGGCWRRGGGPGGGRPLLPPQRRIRGAGAAVAAAAPGPKVPGCRAHTTSDAEQTDAVAARISPHPVARRA